MNRNTEFTRFELSLKDGVKAIIVTPVDIEKQDLLKLKKYIEMLMSQIEKEGE